MRGTAPGRRVHASPAAPGLHACPAARRRRSQAYQDAFSRGQPPLFGRDRSTYSFELVESAMKELDDDECLTAFQVRPPRQLLAGVLVCGDPPVRAWLAEGRSGIASSPRAAGALGRLRPPATGGDWGLQPRLLRERLPHPNRRQAMTSFDCSRGVFEKWGATPEEVEMREGLAETAALLEEQLKAMSEVGGAGWGWLWGAWLASACVPEAG